MTVGNKNISAAYEPWFKLKGLDLLEAVNEHQASAEALFIDTIGELTQDNRQVADITVILNMYRRPSNMPMQVKAVKGQSVKPKQVWTWVNAHEDNENYDKSRQPGSADQERPVADQAAACRFVCFSVYPLL